jgi:17beta-estradiol 17-dehydrogenase/3beta-hydroxysteroid 3-dehydrogenase/mitotic-spindle organizing protein 1
MPKLQQTIFPERIQEYSRSIFLLREELDERFQDFKIMESEFMLLAFPFKADIEKAPENLQMELINLQCDTNLNQKFSETKLQDFYFYLPKYIFPLLRYFGLRMIAIFGSTYVCEQFFPLVNNNKTKSRSRLTNGHMKSVMTMVSNNISPRIKILSQSKRCQVSNQSTG